MAPEKGNIPASKILTEAERIEQILLAEQIEVQDELLKREKKLLGNVRSELGYDAPDEVDVRGLVDTRIEDKTLVVTPQAVTQVLPMSNRSAETTRRSREEGERIIKGDDDRLLVIAGPCSIHDPESALEYAREIRKWRAQYGDTLEIIMRAYMEKPRTELGWKGFIYDPTLDDSYNINLGIIMSRILACQITDMDVPIAMERLNASTPQYFNGLVAYDAIGARNTTDQKAREYASGTSSVVGFKNTPEGSVKAAAEAVTAANAPHVFLGMDPNGLPMQVTTKGNESAHIILRGDQNGPNYAAKHIAKTKEILGTKGLLEAIVVDASHGNSNKAADKQIEVIMDIAEQIAMGEAAIRGVMLESNIVAGQQKLVPGKELRYGQSITDECIDLEQTVQLLQMLSGAVLARRNMTGSTV